MGRTEKSNSLEKADQATLHRAPFSIKGSDVSIAG
jgi:hypothetical protein